MSFFQITAKIPEIGQVAKGILKAVRPEISRRFKKASVNIIREVRRLVRGAIENDITYQAILHGDLQHELGIVNPETVLSRLLNAIVNNIFIDVQPVQVKNGELYSEMNIGVLASDYSDILGRDFSEFVSEHGKRVPWLEWLLFKGDSFILRGWEYVVSPEVVTSSRTNKGIMMQSTRKWRVPVIHSGLPDDNFLTRALEGLDEAIDRIIEQEF